MHYSVEFAEFNSHKKFRENNVFANEIARVDLTKYFFGKRLNLVISDYNRTKLLLFFPVTSQATN